MILMFLRSSCYLDPMIKGHLPAVNSVPASSAVERNSSKALSCVMLRNLTQFGSSWVSVVCYCQLEVPGEGNVLLVIFRFSHFLAPFERF